MAEMEFNLNEEAILIVNGNEIPVYITKAGYVSESFSDTYDHRRVIEYQIYTCETKPKIVR